MAHRSLKPVSISKSKQRTSTVGQSRLPALAIVSSNTSGTSPGILPKATDFERLLTVSEIAEYLRLTPHKIYNLTRRRRQGGRALPCYRGIGKQLLFRLSEVADWVQQRRAA
jgi:excisionase family DNA binding protein